MNFVLDPARHISLDIIFPDRDVSAFAADDGSVVARLVYGSTSVIFTGDTTQKIEHYLLGLASTTLASTVLVVAHHGSKTASSPGFVARVHPQFAIISCGAHNKYNYPAQETLDTLAAAHVPIFRTDTDGTIILKSDGAHFWREK